jgi:tRNA1Val (adenine37-N6)-methyltransferase
VTEVSKDTLAIMKKSATGDAPAAGETLDTICSVNVLQNAEGYRFNVDAVLLAEFAGSVLEPSMKVMDLGTGTGVIGLLLAKEFGLKRVVGLEIQNSLFELALRNVRLNRCEHQMTMVQGDLRHIADYFPAQSFQSVVANPPYRAASKGRTNPHPERALARHEVGCTLQDVVMAAEHLLEERGSFFVVYPAVRLVDLVCALEDVHLKPKRMRWVHPREGQPAKLLLLQAQRRGRGELTVEPPLFLHPARSSAYTAEVQRMLEPRMTSR